MKESLKEKLKRLGEVTKQAQRRLRKSDDSPPKDRDCDLADELGLLVGYLMGVMEQDPLFSKEIR